MCGLCRLSRVKGLQKSVPSPATWNATGDGFLNASATAEPDPCQKSLFPDPVRLPSSQGSGVGVAAFGIAQPKNPGS